MTSAVKRAREKKKKQGILLGVIFMQSIKLGNCFLPISRWASHHDDRKWLTGMLFSFTTIIATKLTVQDIHHYLVNISAKNCHLWTNYCIQGFLLPGRLISNAGMSKTVNPTTNIPVGMNSIPVNQFLSWWCQARNWQETGCRQSIKNCTLEIMHQTKVYRFYTMENEVYLWK